jgi:hypothetical protein
MRWRVLLLLLAAVLILVFSIEYFRRSPEAALARRIAARATTGEQRRLWTQAADRGSAIGLGRLGQPRQPVQRRAPSTVVSQAVPSRGAGLIPPGVVSALRIIATAGMENVSLDGNTVTVSSVDATGERVTLDVGGNRTITFQARAGGRGLQLMLNDLVRVEYHASNGQMERRQILAVRAPNGTGIARITETAEKPVIVRIPMFDLEASQLTPVVAARGGPPSTGVSVRVGAETRRMTAGQMLQIGGMTVGLLASRTPGAQPANAEGSPYVIELIAWR